VGHGVRPADGCALVTGAARGIGAAVAKALADDGWPVAVNYLNSHESARSTVASIQAAGGQAILLQGDVRDPAKDLVRRAEEELGPVLALINNAGVRADGLALSLSEEDWDQVLSVNLSAAFHLTRAVLRPMIRARFGRVISIASVVGPQANAGQANYAASKAGLISMSKTIAVEVASRGITINTVAPGLIETEMTVDVPDALRDAVPAHRAGTPTEVAACVRFLASDQASYVTASTIYVDGGLSA
jgi:3-oxoacyl-[acyl-carrier protein] reductase